MALVTFTDGPLDGQEKELNDPSMFASEHPGYSLQEQSIDPDKGQLMKAAWMGDEAAEAHYPDAHQETGRRDRQEGQRSEAGRTTDRQEGERTGQARQEADRKANPQRSTK